MVELLETEQMVLDWLQREEENLRPRDDRPTPFYLKDLLTGIDLSPSEIKQAIIRLDKLGFIEINGPNMEALLFINKR